jgi:hypothetical protein
MIWATRGRRWGFRFLLDGDEPDPLPAYERAFVGLDGESSVFRRAGHAVAVRFPDPQGRRDEAGRIIPHDLVVRPPLADQVRTLEDGLELFGRLLDDAYTRMVDEPRPPTPEEVDRAFGNRRP